MKKIQIGFFVWSCDEGKFLFQSNCFEEELHKTYLDLLENNKKNKYSYVKLITKQLELNKKSKIPMHPQDVLDDLFRKYVYLDYKFIAKLNLCDSFYGSCFNSKNEIGKAIIELIQAKQLGFLITKKSWWDKHILNLELQVFHIDNEIECHNYFSFGDTEYSH